MPRSQSQSQPSFREAYARAEAAWFRGEYRETLLILADIPVGTKAEQADAALLRARAEQRARRYEAALEAARSAGGLLDGDRLATSLMLQGASLTRLNALDEAEIVLSRAAAIRGVHRTIEAEIILQQAFLAWFRRDLRTSRSLAVKAIGRADDIVLARAQELIGFINASEERYGDAARSYREALTTLGTAKHADHLLKVNLIIASASLAIEGLDVSAQTEIREALRSVTWTADLAKRRYHAYDLAGWLALLSGDPATAWSDFTTAQMATEDGTANRMAALTNLASLHRSTNELFAAQQYIGQALHTARAINWTAANSDERAEHLLTATEAARLGMPMSVEELRAFDKLPTGSGNHAFDGGDRRYRAFRLVAHGVTMRGPSRERAAKKLEEALTIWMSLGYRFRATTTALDLYRMTGHSKYLETAQRETAGLKAGYLVRTIHAERRRDSRGVKNLTRAERRVLAEILEGKTIPQIAEETGRAEQTVRNQNQAIFDALRVSNKGELFVVCAEIGLTAETLAQM